MSLLSRLQYCREIYLAINFVNWISCVFVATCRQQISSR